MSTHLFSSFRSPYQQLFCYIRKHCQSIFGKNIVKKCSGSVDRCLYHQQTFIEHCFSATSNTFSELSSVQLTFLLCYATLFLFSIYIIYRYYIYCAQLKSSSGPLNSSGSYPGIPPPHQPLRFNYSQYHFCQKSPHYTQMALKCCQHSLSNSQSLTLSQAEPTPLVPKFSITYVEPSNLSSVNNVVW